MDLTKFIYFLTLMKFYNAEPFTLVFGGSLLFGMSSIILFQQKILCLFSECCKPKSVWLPMNMTKLENDLTTIVYGQPFVKSVLLRHIKLHISNDNPSRALLLSFNGMPGTGKNFVSQMIANSLFKEGMHSKNVHIFLSTIHFPSEQKVDDYKKELQDKIFTAVKRCPYSLFIFDEVHDMPGNLLDSIKPFMDMKESVNGVDFRKTIFLLLSNSGGKEINTKFFEATKEGRTRDQLTVKEMEEVLERNLFKMKNDGLQNSKLIKHGLISGFVPFLPLQKEHLVLCLKVLLRPHGRHHDLELINKVIDSLDFQNMSGVMVATHGCKRIEDKLKIFI